MTKIPPVTKAPQPAGTPEQQQENENFCAQNPNDPSCSKEQAPTQQQDACAQNPNDPSCSTKQPQATEKTCAVNPKLPGCEQFNTQSDLGGAKGEEASPAGSICEQNPQLPQCQQETPETSPLPLPADTDQPPPPPGGTGQTSPNPPPPPSGTGQTSPNPPPPAPELQCAEGEVSYRGHCIPTGTGQCYSDSVELLDGDGARQCFRFGRCPQGQVELQSSGYGIQCADSCPSTQIDLAGLCIHRGSCTTTLGGEIVGEQCWLDIPEYTPPTYPYLNCAEGQVSYLGECVPTGTGQCSEQQVELSGRDGARNCVYVGQCPTGQVEVSGDAPGIQCANSCPEGLFELVGTCVGISYCSSGLGGDPVGSYCVLEPGAPAPPPPAEDQPPPDTGTPPPAPGEQPAESQCTASQVDVDGVCMSLGDLPYDDVMQVCLALVGAGAVQPGAQGATPQETCENMIANGCEQGQLGGVPASEAPACTERPAEDQQPPDTGTPPPDTNTPPPGGTPPPDGERPPMEDQQPPAEDQQPPTEDQRPLPPDARIPPPGGGTQPAPPPGPPAGPGQPPKAPVPGQGTKPPPETPGIFLARTGLQPPFAVVISNDRYQAKDIPPKPHAQAGADSFARVLRRDMRLDRLRIIRLSDPKKSDLDALFGTKGNPDGNLKVALANAAPSELILYYAGHALPIEGGSDAVLLPSDVDPANLPATGYRLSTLYAKLQAFGVRRLRFYLDAGFSENLAAIPMAITAPVKQVNSHPSSPPLVRLNAPQWVVITAGRGNQPTLSRSGEPVSIFTQYLLRGLRGAADRAGNRNNAVSAGELITFLQDQVTRSVKSVTGGTQTPSFSGPATEILNVIRPAPAVAPAATPPVPSTPPPQPEQPSEFRQPPPQSEPQPAPEPEKEAETVKAVAPSFDCGAARTRGEKAICANPDLAELDSRMASLSDARRAALQGAELNEFTKAQERWIGRRQACRGNVPCMTIIYRHWIETLQ